MLVSVVIPCYAQAHYLGEAIRSALEQREIPLEILVVDDGSPDDVGAVVRRYSGVTHLRQDNAGLAAARNTGLTRARGEHVIFLDADDRLVPSSIARSLYCFRSRPEAVMVWGRCTFIDHTGRATDWVGPHGSVYRMSEPYVGDDPYCDLLRSCIVWTPGIAMFRRDVFQHYGPFDESVSPAADLEMYLRIAKRATIAFHDSVVLEYRCHAANMTRDRALMLDATLQVLEAERAYAERDPRYRRALNEGIDSAREYWASASVRRMHRFRTRVLGLKRRKGSDRGVQPGTSVPGSLSRADRSAGS